MTGENIFPETMHRYDEYVLREAINNAIAHSDYSFDTSIDVVEYENEKIVISNMGSFLPRTLDKVLESNAPYSRYRNNTLASAMVKLKLIDKVGSGIRMMFRRQRKRFFPMPEYFFEEKKTQITIPGKIIDLHFARAISQRKDLGLLDISLLYALYTKKHVEKAAASRLREKNLVVGRYPHLRVSPSILPHIKDEGIKQKIILQQEMSKEAYEAHIKDALSDGHPKTRHEIFALIQQYLPSEDHPRRLEVKISSVLKRLKKAGVIENEGTRRWSRWKLKGK